jgi:uncharacterized protein (TIGR02145 family)
MENHMPIGKIIMRLVILKNYITLGDIDEIQRESEKLNQFSERAGLNEILYSIQYKELSRAVALIDSFITTHQQLTVCIDPEIAALQTEVAILENRLISLINQRIASINIKSVRIGNQIWMVENLNVDRFRNGDPIPEVRSDEEWVRAGDNDQPAWCYYDNDLANGAKYGKLYNWCAVNDPRGLAPQGWHVPSDAEWTQLTDFLGGEGVAGTKLKNNNGWNTYDGKSGNGNNESGFSGLPGGFRYNFNGTFSNVGYYGYWWSSTEDVAGSAWYRYLYYFNGDANRFTTNKQNGFSVRCLRD